MRRTSTSTERRPSDPNAPADTILDLDALGGGCVWHVLGLQRSVREWAMAARLERPASARRAGARDPGGGAGHPGRALWL